MWKNKITYLLTSLAVLFSGCNKTDNDESAARLRVKITGSTYSTINKFNIELQSIEINIVDSLKQTGDNWKKIEYKGGTYNLFGFSNGVSKQIVDQYFTPKIIKQVRLKFGNQHTIETPLEKTSLTIPEEYKEGFVFNTNIELQPFIIESIMLDFDALQSVFVKDKNHYLIPRVRVYAETYGGKLSGTITPAQMTSLVKISLENDSIFSFPSNGAFVFSGLTPGKWKIRVIPDSLHLYKDTVFTDSIFAGKTTTVKIPLLKVKKQP